MIITLDIKYYSAFVVDVIADFHDLILLILFNYHYCGLAGHAANDRISSMMKPLLMLHTAAAKEIESTLRAKGAHDDESLLLSLKRASLPTFYAAAPDIIAHSASP